VNYLVGFIAIFLFLLVLAYQRASLMTFTLSGFVILLTVSIVDSSPLIPWILFSLIFIPLNIKQLRQFLISIPVLKVFKKLMPAISETEQEALDAGTVWWEAELFKGAPDWKQLHNIPAPRLSPEEESFLAGPVEELCQLANDWEITHQNAALPKKVWSFIKDNGFLGMIIPKSYGGLEFSAYAHSRVLIKLNSISGTLGTSVSVPNSLGPAELLLHYGTEQQKDYYLPRLAKGKDIPCFALTAPEAGSDASAIPDFGVVCRGEYEGKETLGMRLNWNKRYITLAPVATLLGLAFKLEDPDHLLGETEHYGITCALIPVSTKGVTTGRRHFPLNVPFQNGPTQGEDVFVPLDTIIGGSEMAGKGWQMLVDCLSTGRALSLPSGAIAGSKVAAMSAGAYARIRRQFNLPIGKMEGIEEALARIAGYAYSNTAVGAFTTAGIDIGEKPSVASAIVKYHTTENARKAIIDAMDIHGGKGIVLGPKNYLGRLYQGAPIGITVEGANILTRSLIIFGQGSIRCHPYLLKEINAVHADESNQAIQNFDEALFGHLGFAFSNLVRGAWLGFSSARWTRTPFKDTTRRYYQHMARFSAVLAFISDVVLGILGGELKRKESVSARLGDVLSSLYICSAILKKYDDDGRHQEDLPVVNYSVETQLYNAQQAIFHLLDNFPLKSIAWFIRLKMFPWGRPIKKPLDETAHRVATILLQPSETRSRIGEGIFLTPSENNPLGKMEQVLEDTIAADSILLKLHQSLGKKGTDPLKMAKLGLAAGLINPQAAELIERAELGRQDVISVDDFDSNELSAKQ